MRRLFLAVAIGLLAASAGCEDLDEFRTNGREVFSGQVVGSDSGDAGLHADCDFVLCGFPERTTLTLRDFDPGVAGGPMTTGSITTDDGTLMDATLVPIVGLQHDALSEYTFPGGRRIRNFMLGARFGADGSRYAMLFVSLMNDGRIEIRVHAPSTTPSSNDALFGVFRLCRGGCAP